MAFSKVLIFHPTLLFQPTCLLNFQKNSFLHIYSNLHDYQIMQNFPSYMFIPTYTCIRNSRVPRFLGISKEKVVKCFISYVISPDFLIPLPRFQIAIYTSDDVTLEGLSTSIEYGFVIGLTFMR